MRIRIFLKLTVALGIVSTLAGIVALADEANKSGTIAGTVQVKGAKSSADVVVYLEGVSGEFPLPNEHAVMNQRGKKYIPHVLPILKDTEVDIINSDELLHNVHAYWIEDKSTMFNIAQPLKGQKYSRKLKKEGDVLLLCDQHAEMSAYIVVLPNPYFAKTDESGSFVIEKVLPGKYTLKVWHEKNKGESLEVIVEQGKTTTVNLILKKRK